MRRRRFIVGSAASAAALVVPTSAPNASTKPIHVGAVLPLTGGLDFFGKQARAGINMAVKEINAAGGVLGRRLKVTFADNRTDPRMSLERSLQLIKLRKVVAVIGPIASSARDAMIPTHKRHKTPLLYATNYEGGACDRYVFSFNTVPHQELTGLVPALAESAGKEFYLFGVDYHWAHESFRQARKLIKTAGGKVVGEEYVPFGTDAFAATIRRIRDSEATVLLKAVPGIEGVSFVRQAQAFGLMDQVTVGYLGLSEAYLSEFGPKHDQSMWVSVPFSASMAEPDVSDFLRRARRALGAKEPVTHYVLSHYNTVNALAAGLVKAGKVGRKALIGGLEGLKLDTPTGPLQIDARTHHANIPMFLARSQGDQLRVIRPLGPIKPKAACD